MTVSLKQAKVLSRLSDCGSQRDWVWRGWQTRYSYIRAAQTGAAQPPIILLHGFGASLGHWRHNLPVLSADRDVYALDLLGFGGSRKAVANYNISLWVEQLYEFWQNLIQQPAILVGNSIGSLVGLAAADAHPEMVRGVTMISLHDPGARADVMPGWLQTAIAPLEGLVASPPLLKIIFYLVRRPPVVRKWAAMAYSHPSAITDELVEILTQPAQDKGSAQAFANILRAMTSAKFGPSVKTILPQLQVPLLLIWGKQDRMIPPGLAQRFVQLNPQVQLIELADAGHCAHDECPEEVNQIILDWLKEAIAPNL